MNTKTYNANGAVMGRLATVVAKDLLEGNNVNIINAEEIAISGKKELIVARLLQKRKMGAGGSLKGPTYIRKSDRLLKRMIRGMLPWDKPKGREAYKRLKCYEGNGECSEEQLKAVIEINHHIPNKHVILKDVVRALQ